MIADNPDKVENIKTNIEAVWLFFDITIFRIKKHCSFNYTLSVTELQDQKQNDSNGNG